MSNMQDPEGTPATEDEDQLLTVADICGRIGVHEQTVYGWIRSGELAAIKFGSRIGYRIELANYKDFLRRRSTTGAISRLLLLGTLPTVESDR
jgi:excisionase family DNA binding protein